MGIGWKSRFKFCGYTQELSPDVKAHFADKAENSKKTSVLSPESYYEQIVSAIIDLSVYPTKVLH